jgi:NAD-dependent oxidoreductase involved in siderophore biosynthesis
MPDLTPEYLVSLYAAPGPAGDVLPLRGLSNVDWSTVKDAYGPAIRVPALLRALISDNADHRQFACELLFQSIWHQGDVYESTPLAVPFLFNLLEAEGPHDKVAIATLLATIADGYPPISARCAGNSKSAEEWRTIFAKNGMNIEDEIAKERRFMADLQRELAARSALLVPYEREQEPEAD